MVSNIISLHVGQAGVQLGHACWQLFCLEHGIEADGSWKEGNPQPEKTDGLHSMFFQDQQGKFTPRSIFVDLETSSLDQLRTGSHKQLYGNDQFSCSSQQQCKSVNYANARNRSVDEEVVDDCIEKIRRQVEKCDNRVDGFMVYHSLGGGVGSGFTSLLLERLSVDYQQVNRTELAIYPNIDETVNKMEAYNAVLGHASVHSNVDLSFVLENSAIQSICKNKLGVAKPTLFDLNCIIAQFVSTLTASIRFDGALNVDLKEMVTNLVPHPELHYITSAMAPFLPTSSTVRESVTEITKQAFLPQSSLAKITHIGSLMACTLSYRGDVVPRDVMAAVSSIKTQRSIQFVDWCPTGFKCGIHYTSSPVLPGSPMAVPARLISVMTNSNAVNQVFSRLACDFDLLYEKRYLLHKYTEQGMEEEEFVTAREHLATVVHNYDEACVAPGDEAAINENG